MSVARSQSEVEVSEAAEEVGDLGIVGEDAQDFGDGSFSPAPGVDTVCVFPKNSARCKNFMHIEQSYCLMFVNVFLLQHVG